MSMVNQHLVHVYRQPYTRLSETISE